MRTVGELLLNNGIIYVWFSTQELCRHFLKQAEREGFSFGDGVKPTKRETDDYLAINPDWTLNYIGLMGRMAFAGAKYMGWGKDRQKIIRIDYAKYISGRRDYIILLKSAQERQHLR